MPKKPKLVAGPSVLCIAMGIPKRPRSSVANFKAWAASGEFGAPRNRKSSRRPDWGLKEWIQLFNRGISYQVGAVIPPSAIPMPSISSLFPNTPCANLPHQHRSLWDGGQSSPIHPNSLRLTRPFSVRFFICSKRHPQELSIHASLMPPPSLSLSSNSWSHPPIVFNSVMLWAACCLATRPPHMYLSSHQMSQLT